VQRFELDLISIIGRQIKFISKTCFIELTQKAMCLKNNLCKKMLVICRQLEW